MMPFPGRCTITVGALLVLLAAPAPTAAVETGPVERKWGLGWDRGLTARLWLGGVWELGLAAGPDDFRSDGQRRDFNSGYPPGWIEREQETISSVRNESGFVRFQAGRLAARRGPLALVGYAGVAYSWRVNGDARLVTDVEEPERSYTQSYDYDDRTWTVSLGLRPSWVILDFLTLETAFGLEYRWFTSERRDDRYYPATGETNRTVDTSEGNTFRDGGWNGLGYLQFIVWF